MTKSVKLPLANDWTVALNVVQISAAPGVKLTPVTVPDPWTEPGAPVITTCPCGLGGGTVISKALGIGVKWVSLWLLPQPPKVSSATPSHIQIALLTPLILGADDVLTNGYRGQIFGRIK